MDTQPSCRKTLAADFDSLPYLTAELPGIGGTLKRQPDDFVVEEIPAYEPSGAGEHLFLWVEKEDVSGEELLGHVARRVGISTRDIGMAGMKDRRAITRQWISVPARYEPSISEVASDRVRVLRAVRHANKLRTGHLRGNRFSILVRDVAVDAADRSAQIGKLINHGGFPNYFGAQRFGREHETLQLGLDLLRGQVAPQSIPASRRRFLLRMSLSAAQSALFNAVLAARLSQGSLFTMLLGDVMQVVASGGLFVVEDPTAEQQRFDRREIVVTGPICGPKMRAPQGRPAAFEQAVLADWNLSVADLSRFPKLTSGTRRPLIARASNLTIRGEEAGLRINFDLASGCYATSLLREFMKTPSPN